MSFILYSDVTTFTIYPGYGLARGGEKLGSSNRSKDGTLYDYLYAQFNVWRLPVFYVDSEFMSIVNSWWSVNKELNLTTDFDEAYSVRITNDTKPIDLYIGPYDNLFQGTLNLSQSQ